MESENLIPETALSFKFWSPINVTDLTLDTHIMLFALTVCIQTVFSFLPFTVKEHPVTLCITGFYFVYLFKKLGCLASVMKNIYQINFSVNS